MTGILLCIMFPSRPCSDRQLARGNCQPQCTGDSGIGWAVAVALAKQGADMADAYLGEHEDAAETVRAVEHYQRQCVAIPVDLREPDENALVVAKR